MANELALSLSLSFNKPGVTVAPVGRAVSGLLLSVSGTAYIEGTMLAPITTPTTIPLGKITSCGYAWFQNMDPTNAVQLVNGGGTLVQIPPGMVACFPLLPAAAPTIVALIAPCLVEFLIITA